eukprot:Phypoly_transcript_08376.p1 GENE.Phypoly_transcript_08376~~Phypoly_transcript_08376.p1  ORF type:complete len:397 (+),score=55.73 Phypoly_transcript_08376:184-1374(+)
MSLSTAPKITETLNSYTSKVDGIPGVAFRAVKKDGSVLYEGASGLRGIDHKDQQMTVDTVFKIASCSKLLTAVSALQLIEQGKLALDDHAEKYLPELGKFQILTGFDAGNQPIFQEPKTKITIRHLLTHTAGFNYDFYNPLTKKYSELNNIPSALAFKKSTLLCPLSFEPGTSWEYSTSMDWLGLVIQEVSGQSLDAYMKQHIFEPLGIHSTTFLPNAEQIARLAHMHPRVQGKLVDAGKTVTEVEFHSGGAGLYSTVQDYSTVLFALLNDGDGAFGSHKAGRILKKETVDLLCSIQETPSLDKTMETQTPEITPTAALPAVPKGWTFGGLRIEVPLPTGRSAGAIGWAGLPNCYWWLDRTKGVAGVIMTQILPLYDTEVNQCYAACESLVYAGLN